MRGKIKDFLFGLLGVVAYIGFFGLLIFFGSVNGSENNSYSKEDDSSVICETFTIDYDTTEEYTDELDDGDSEVIEGEYGEQEVCTSYGEEVSSTLIKEPVTEVVRYGTHQEEYYIRTGAICYDGSYSTATGRGACSWHGGVDEWIYD